MKIPSSSSFTLQGGDSSFENRQKALFNELSQAERACNVVQPVSDYPDLAVGQFRRPPPPGKRRRTETRQFKGQESIFKRPELPSPFADRNIPDYVRNPHKWAKYSLADVSNEDMSDRSNTQAALSFLNGLRARRLKERAAKGTDDMEVDDGQHESASDRPSTSKVSFRKPWVRRMQRETLAVEDKEEKPVFRGSKIVLPEYVIGQKVMKKDKKEKCAEKVDRSKQLKLQHLEEQDAEDE
ncbi:U5 small nuclear ribonucleoprotein TSSC4 [Diachasmimorpha longicaudata]|uniref:U5 small nuclear ribonucleoprotein TSSC4 n=1 Tax=Diachasmimorpha longicaudata TaxID=58733 RepID=UPI0030B8E8A1